MAKRLLRLVPSGLARVPASHSPACSFSIEDVVRAMGGFCVLNRKPFDAELMTALLPDPWQGNRLTLREWKAQ